MKKSGPDTRRNDKAKSDMILGRERFAKISAVEGVRLTAGMRKRAAEFDRHGTPAAERRRAIVQAYRKS
jgi:hypothetical protein